MIHWWQSLSFSAAFLWLFLAIGTLVLLSVLMRAAGQRRPDVLDPPHWSTRRDSPEAAGKVRRG
jgi:hypothetical protein